MQLHKILRTKRNRYFLLVLFFLLVIYYLFNNAPYSEHKIVAVRRQFEENLAQALKYDKGSGCEVPQLNPFSTEARQFDVNLSKPECHRLGANWAKCQLSVCSISQHIQDHYRDVNCHVRDIIYHNDNKLSLGDIVSLKPGGVYHLNRSDHLKVSCTGYKESEVELSKWRGHVLGFRELVSHTPPPGREDTINVLIFGFDSTSKNVFIRRMPKSYKVLVETLKAHIFDGFNIVGDGTPATLFPLMTGKTELELPDMRKVVSRGTVDEMPWIWYKLKNDGYRTAYFEDMPWIGTFQYRFNGFAKQPADHYLRAFYMEAFQRGSIWWSNKSITGTKVPARYCVGDTPTNKLMMNITKDFHRLPGKKFSFTFVADITHDDFNMIATADDDFAELLTDFSKRGLDEDTMLVVMSDHGARFAKARNTLTGKLEERLPFLSILLPKKLKERRGPKIDENMTFNQRALITPHDLHATVLDALDWREHWNPHKVKGADLPRGLTLFEPLPTNRSCSEAGIEPHWCTCLKWQEVSSTDSLYKKAAQSFVDYINELTEGVRNFCVPRTLVSVNYVQKQKLNEKLLAFSNSNDHDGYIAKFGDNTKYITQNYQVKVTVGPNSGIYEASAVYNTQTKKFTFNTRDISRINAYGNEPSCISHSHPHLNMYCYCK